MSMHRPPRNVDTGCLGVSIAAAVVLLLNVAMFAGVIVFVVWLLRVLEVLPQ